MELVLFGNESLGVFIEQIARCQDTMMGGIGHYGSYQCLVVTTLYKCLMRLMNAKRHIQMHI